MIGDRSRCCSDPDAGCGFGFETKHGASASFDATVILLNVIVHKFAGTNGNRFASLYEPALCITLRYSYSVGLAAINGDALRPAVAGKSFADEAFGSTQITLFAEIEFNRIGGSHLSVGNGG